MQESSTIAAPAVEPQSFGFEFRGSGGEFFRIWIVNLALTLLTLGVYGAWAKVRTWRYFYGNTYLAGHPFEYHASPVRILIGRLIALSLFLAYSISANIYPLSAIAWAFILLAALPWLANASIRFNARNSSYRNVRFNFTGCYKTAFAVYVLWPIAAVLTFFVLLPRARKARDYYFINRHTFGGRPFETEFSNWAIYGIYLLGLAILLVPIAGSVAIFYGYTTYHVFGPTAVTKAAAQPSESVQLISFAAIAFMYSVMLFIAVMIQTMIFNLAIGHTKLDGRHELRAKLSPLRMAWILLTNIVLTLLTIGIYYPWAQVRLARYRRSRLAVLAASNLDDFTSEAIATQSAVGEEIAGFFDLGFGL